jgi:O-methyltransferase
MPTSRQLLINSTNILLSFQKKFFLIMKRLIDKLISKIYFATVKKKHLAFEPAYVINNLTYSSIETTSNYAPWIGDREFFNTFSQIKLNTLVDIYRCYELWELTKKIHEIDPLCSFIEIGVWRGGTAGIIAKKLLLSGAENKFYIADTFSGVVKASEEDKYYSGGEHKDTSEEIVKKLLDEKIEYKNYTILKGIFPNETANLISIDERFGFCHIDVDVYESAKDIVDWIWDKIIIGGVIIFDDFGFHTCNGITKYVEEQKSKKDRIIIHNLNGHAVMIRIK